MLLEPCDDGGKRISWEVCGDEIGRELPNRRGIEPGEVGLVLLDRMNAAHRHVAQQEKQIREQLPRPLLPLCP